MARCRYAVDQFCGGRSDPNAFASARLWYAANVAAAGLPMMFMGTGELRWHTPQVRSRLKEDWWTHISASFCDPPHCDFSLLPPLLLPMFVPPEFAQNGWWHNDEWHRLQWDNAEDEIGEAALTGLRGRLSLGGLA